MARSEQRVESGECRVASGEDDFRRIKVSRFLVALKNCALRGYSLSFSKRFGRTLLQLASGWFCGSPLGETFCATDTFPGNLKGSRHPLGETFSEKKTPLGETFPRDHSELPRGKVPLKLPGKETRFPHDQAAAT